MSLQETFNRPVSRRTLLKAGAVIATELAVQPALSLFDLATAGATEISGEAVNPIRAFKYYPLGEGLEPLLEDFARFHRARTRNKENILPAVADYMSLWPEVNSLHPNSAGICTGASQCQAYEMYVPETFRMWDFEFSPVDIDGIGALLHFGDDWVKERRNGAPVNFNRLNTPAFIHSQLTTRLMGAGEGLVLDRSTNPDEYWTHPIKKVNMEVTPLNSNGLIRVNARLTCGNYVESPQTGDPYREFGVAYVVNESDPESEGEFVTPDHSDPIYVASIHRPDPTHQWADFDLKRTIFLPSVIESFRMLTGELPFQIAR